MRGARLALDAGLCQNRRKARQQGAASDSKEFPMTNGRVTGVRSIELGVRDLRQSAEFYGKAWALEEVASEGDTIHFRGTGAEHHLLTVCERAKPSLLGVHFSASNRAAVDELCAKARSQGVAGVTAP